MNNLIDIYSSNFAIYGQGYVTLNCEYGELTFLKNKTKMLIIHGIFIKEQYKKKGICRNILQYIVDVNNANNANDVNNANNKFKQLCFNSVLSKILYEYLLRFEYKNKKFRLTKTGFYMNL
jgi:predicted GNAT family acetyltransferase